MTFRFLARAPDKIYGCPRQLRDAIRTESEACVTNENERRTALVLSYSDIASDPRVRRQIDWLAGGGWVVDTIGLGNDPSPLVRDHFPLSAPSRWTTTRAGVLLTHFSLPPRRRFQLQFTNRVDDEALVRLRTGLYDLVVFNETEFLPWVSDQRTFTPEAMHAKIHLDLHEYHNPRVRRQTLGARLTGSHYRWVRRHIGHPAFTSRSVVNEPIGQLYVKEFGIEPPVPSRNIPRYESLTPSAVDPGEIRLLFHGLAAWQRGFTEILDAMRVLPERFTMTFMLMPNRAVVDELQALIDAHPARHRMRIVPPAPMRDIARSINEFDLEIIFYRPLAPNLEFALPNKFFEAVQGRLGVVVGESPAMAAVVREFGNGVIVSGFDASDLAETLAALSSEDIAGFKAAANDAAHQLNSEAEGRAFLAAIGMHPVEGQS